MVPNRFPCRYSGLPVSHPKLFVSRYPDSNYFVDMAKLGDRIVSVKASGYVRSYEMSELLIFFDDYISSHFVKNKGIIYLEDYADVEGADVEARKEYIQYLKNNDMFWGWVAYNLPSLYRISFKIAKRLHAVDRHMYAEVSFEAAVDRANNIIRQCNTGHIFRYDPSPRSQEEPIKNIGRFGNAFSARRNKNQ